MRLVIFSLLLTFMLFFLTFTRLTHGAEVPRIAVYYFSNQTGTEEWEWLERGMADMLERTFSQSEKLHCITLSEIDQAVDREKFEGLSESKELSFFQSLNNLLKVDTIFTGNFSMNTQGEIRFNLLMYQSQLNELFEFREEVSPPDDLLEIKEKFAEVIMREMDIAIDEELALLLNKNISSSIPALKAYYQAIEFKNKAIQEYQGIDFPSKPLWTEAIEYAEKAVIEDPQFAEAYYLLAEIYERTKWTFREVQNLEKFIETAENNMNIQVSYQKLSESLYRLAYSKYTQGDIHSAITDLEEAIGYYPKNIQAREYLMRIYYQIGEISKALQQAEEIKKIEPNNQEIEWFKRKTQQAAKYG
ncbi:MAG: tetratricopeptide repeat protein, partial [Elusimicrobiota bacterium]